MEFGKRNGILHGGLTLVAALMLSGAAMAQDAATDPSVTDPGIEVVEPAIIDVTVVDDGTVVVDDGQGIAVGEPDPNDDYVEGDEGYVDTGEDTEWVEDTGWVDDTGSVEDTGTDVDGTDPDVMFYTTGGEFCIDCNVIPSRPLNPTEVQRNLTDVAPGVALGGTSSSRSSAALASTTAMAQCMMQHPRSTWMCEWQNGAGQ